MAGRSEFYCEVVYHDDIPDSWPPSLIREIGILKQGTKFHRFFRTYSESVTREKHFTTIFCCFIPSVPVEYRTARTKPEIALAEIDRVTAAGVRFGCVLADAGYGLSAPFRHGLTARNLAWAVGIPRHLKVYPVDVRLIWPVAKRGRPRRRYIPDILSMPAGRSQMANGELADRDEGQAQSPLCRGPRPHRRWATAADQG